MQLAQYEIGTTSQRWCEGTNDQTNEKWDSCMFLDYAIPILTHTILLTFCPFSHTTRHDTDHREEASAALLDGMKQLEMLQRQTVLSQLYPSARSVME